MFRFPPPPPLTSGDFLKDLQVALYAPAPEWDKYGVGFCLSYMIRSPIATVWAWICNNN